MAEVVVEFDTAIVGKNGTRWVPRVCGGLADDGLWEGWIEFTPTNPSLAAVRTPRETEQSKRDDLMYWAQGLTQAYLEEALRRAIDTSHPAVARPTASGPHFGGPAPRPRIDVAASALRPVLNPFQVYEQGEAVLIQQLSAFDAARLRDIAVAYGFLSASVAEGRSRKELTTAIITSVRPGGAVKSRSSRESRLSAGVAVTASTPTK